MFVKNLRRVARSSASITRNLRRRRPSAAQSLQLGANDAIPAARQLLINITEVDASTVMEAGLILPQPGEEAAWFERNRAQLSALAPDGIKGL
jgi:hypothetical protein